MDEMTIFKQVLTQGPFAALFVWLLLSTKKESREREKDSKDREAKLMDHIDKMSIQFERNTTTLQQIERSLSGLENDLKEVWEHIDKKGA